MGQWGAILSDIYVIYGSVGLCMGQWGYVWVSGVMRGSVGLCVGQWGYALVRVGQCGLCVGQWGNVWVNGFMGVSGVM